MKVALLQIASPDAEPMSDRVARVGEMVAGLEPVDLVVLPELWSVGYFSFDHYADVAQPLDGQLARTLADWARVNGVYLAAGSVVERDTDGHLYNSAVLFDPQGSLVHVYRKVHVFGYRSLEAQLLTPGSKFETVRTPFGGIGVSTCYDLRFPELYRCLVDRGMKILIAPAAWPLERLEHWRLFTRARAVENQVWVIACGAAGTQRGVTLSGHSDVVDPWGAVVAEAGSGEQILYADLRPELVDEIRAEFPALEDRAIRTDQLSVGARKQSVVQ